MFADIFARCSGDFGFPRLAADILARVSAVHGGGDFRLGWRIPFIDADIFARVSDDARRPVFATDIFASVSGERALAAADNFARVSALHGFSLDGFAHTLRCASAIFARYSRDLGGLPVKAAESLARSSGGTGWPFLMRPALTTELS
jgi:hypothetical protein